MGFLINLLINGLAVYITAYVLPGVTVDGFVTAIFVSIVWALVNTFIKPILLIFTLPVTILTLGLFTLIINTLMVFIVANLVRGFHVDGFWSALFFSFVVSLVSSILRGLTK